MEDARFHWADYLIFAFTLVVSTGVGIYFGCTGEIILLHKLYIPIIRKHTKSRDNKMIILGKLKCCAKIVKVPTMNTLERFKRYRFYSNNVALFFT